MQFIVKNTPLLHNGKRYAVGSTIELSPEDAEKLSLYLHPIQAETKNAVSEEDIKQAEANIKAAEEKTKKTKA